MLTYSVVISSLRTSIYGSADSTIDPYAGDGIPSVQWCIPANAKRHVVCKMFCLSCPAFAGHVLESCLLHGGTWRPTQLRQVVVVVQIAKKESL